MRFWRNLFTPAAKPPPRLAAEPVPAADPPVAPRGKKVLLVDDDPVILKTTSLKLKSQGYEVVTAMDGAEAISAVRKRKPDLILLDITFPPDVAHGGAVGWDGFLIMSWLHRLEEARTVPVIIVTGGEATKYKDRAMAGGAIAFFNKPIDHVGLLSVIERVVSRELVQEGEFQI